MATYCITFDGTDWNDDSRWQFKYRYRSSGGKPCAQPEFDRLKDSGQYERLELVKWEHNQPLVVERWPS